MAFQKNMLNYLYDNVGNRITKNENGLMTNYTYNNLNQLAQSIENAVTTQYNYDLLLRQLNI